MTFQISSPQSVNEFYEQICFFLLCFVSFLYARFYRYYAMWIYHDFITRRYQISFVTNVKYTYLLNTGLWTIPWSIKYNAALLQTEKKCFRRRFLKSKALKFLKADSYKTHDGAFNKLRCFCIVHELCLLSGYQSSLLTATEGRNLQGRNKNII